MSDAARNRLTASTLVSTVLFGAGLTGVGAGPALGAEFGDEANNLTVMVEGKLSDRDTWGAGIIVASRPDGIYIVTADHVVRAGLHAAEDLRVMLRWHRPHWIEAELLEEDPDLDLAVLYVGELSERKIPVEALRFDLLGQVGGLRRGDKVFHIGNPSGRNWRSNVKPDLVSEVLSTEVRFESALIAGGSSGGGLFDERWRLVGLVRADQPPDGVAVRIDRVVERLDRWGVPIDLTTSPSDDNDGTPAQSEEKLPAGADQPDLRQALRQAEGVVGQWLDARARGDQEALTLLSGAPFYFDQRLLLTPAEVRAEYQRLFAEKPAGRPIPRPDKLLTYTVEEYRRLGYAEGDRVIGTLRLEDDDVVVVVMFGDEGILYFLRRLGDRLELVGFWD